MSFYNNPEEYTKRGIDYDLYACLEYNPQGKYLIDDIDKVLAVVEGENDESDWFWILRLKKPVDGNRFVYLTGGCDYTGWDCSSWASSEYAKTARKALALVVPSEKEWSPHATNAAHTKLAAQLKTKKSKTWKEENDRGVPAIELPLSD